MDYREVIDLIQSIDRSKLASLTSEELEKYHRLFLEYQPAMMGNRDITSCKHRIDWIEAEMDDRRASERHQVILRWTKIAAVAATVGAAAAIIGLLLLHR